QCASYSSAEATLTLNSSPYWNAPQSSSHLPAYVLSRVVVAGNLLVRRGIMPCLYRNAGIRNEWMTSRESSVNSTVSLTGRYSVGNDVEVPAAPSSSSSAVTLPGSASCSPQS